MEDVLAAVQALTGKFDGLSERIDQIEKRNNDAETSRSDTNLPAEGARPSRSRSRQSSSRRHTQSHYRSRSRSGRTPSPKRKHGHHAGGGASRSGARDRRPDPPLGWADREGEIPDFDKTIDFSDSDDDGDEHATKRNPLVEVSEESAMFLNNCCKKSLTNAGRLEIRNKYPLPKVPSTRTPQLDSYMRAELSGTTKMADRELARLQTFMLDAMAPLSAILEAEASDKEMSWEENLTAVKTALQLLGNASSKVSILRREKITLQMNKSLLPLAKDETKFTEAAPMLFGTEFAKSSKEYIDQVKAMRTTLNTNTNNRTNKPYFRGGPSGRGAYSHQRGGATYNRGGYRKNPYYAQTQNSYQRKEFKAPHQSRGKN